MATRMPRILEEEWEHLLDMHLAMASDDAEDWPSEEEANRPLTAEEEKEIREEFDRFLQEHASDELRAYLRYCDRVGDEGEIKDEEGNYILNEKGFRIQEWSESADGYVIDDRTGKILRDRKGNPVIYPVLDARVEKMYEDEGWY